MKLTKSQLRDLKIISEGNVCSKKEYIPFRRIEKYIYIDTTKIRIFSEKMVDKLMKMNLIENGERYSHRHNKIDPFCSYGHYLKITELGKKILNENI